MMKAAIRLPLLITCMVLSVAPLASPQTGEPSTGGQRIVTRTRLVTLFSQLESQLGDAFHRNDAAALGQLLSESFEVWTPEPPGAPIAREEWLQRTRQSAPEVTSIRQMAAKDLGGPVVVNFVLTQRSPGKPAESFFVVDVWAKSGAQWQLTERYLSPTPASPPPQHPSPTGKQ